MLKAIDDALPPDRARAIYVFPYSDMSPSNLVREDGTVFSEEYTEEGLVIDALCSVKVMNKLKSYIPGFPEEEEEF